MDPNDDLLLPLPITLVTRLLDAYAEMSEELQKRGFPCNDPLLMEDLEKVIAAFEREHLPASPSLPPPFD